jgi:hypothetical protein
MMLHLQGTHEVHGMAVDRVNWTIFMANGEIQVQKQNVVELETDHTLDLVGGSFENYGTVRYLVTSYEVYRADGSTHSYNLGVGEGATTYGRKVSLAVTRPLDKTSIADTVAGSIDIHDP